MAERKHIPGHGFPPVIYPDSEILILRSFPSVKSREDDFYYMHPRNRFWKVLSILFQDEAFLSDSVDKKKESLRRHRVALYDVIESCDIVGSKDASINNEKPADIKTLIKDTNVRLIALNGKKAAHLFKKNNPDLIHMSVTLPSTSPANAAFSLEDLVKDWRRIK